MMQVITHSTHRRNRTMHAYALPQLAGFQARLAFSQRVQFVWKGVCSRYQE